MRIPSTPGAAASLRRALACFADQLHSELLDDVGLLATELVSNSITHAGDANEHILIRILSYTDTNAAVRVEVTDDGSGFMPREFVPSIEETHGRGLFIIETIADRWGIEGDGPTRVWLEIDGKSTLLVVDDDEDARRMLSLRLGTGGWVVAEAPSGEEALDRCHRSRFEMVVLDHVMPELTGIEVARALRAEGFERPILLFSAYLNRDVLAQAASLDVIPFPKPHVSPLLEAAASFQRSS